MKSIDANIQHFVIICKETGYNVSGIRRIFCGIRYAVSNAKWFPGTLDTLFLTPNDFL